MNSLQSNAQSAPFSPQFAGRWRVKTEDSYPYYLYTERKVTAEDLQKERTELQGAFQKVDDAIKALPDSMVLTYQPRMLDTYTYDLPADSDIGRFEPEERTQYSLRDDLVISFQSPEAPKPKRQQPFILAALVQDLKELWTGRSGSSMILQRKNYNGWRFWETEPVEKFINRGVQQAQKLVKKGQAV